MSDLDKLAQMPPPAPPPLSAELEAELSKLEPVAPRQPARQLAILAIVSLVYAGGLLASLSLRRDLGELPVAWVVLAGGAWLASFIVTSYLALVPARGSMVPRWQAAGAAAVVTSIAFVALGLVVHPHGTSSLDYGWEHVARGHWCMWLGLATALVPVFVGAIFLRGALAIRSRVVAAALGAGGGCLGGLLLHMHCPIADGWHIGLIHGGVVAVAAALSAALVPQATDKPLR